MEQLRQKVDAIIKPIAKSLGINEPPPVNIERTAISQEGGFGSLYDGYTDNIKGRVNTKDKSPTDTAIYQTTCLVPRGRQPDTQNLLKFVNIEDQLRLSIELNMVPAKGIASVVYYPQPIDNHTRLFHYCHRSHTKSYENGLHELKAALKKPINEKHATHIITKIIYGIHVLAILQLPPNLEEDIDAVLLKISKSLAKKEYSMKMDAIEKSLLDQITTTTVYSNIDELTKMNKFDDVYDKIRQMEKNVPKHRPLKYILTPLTWFYGQHAVSIPTLVLYESDETEMLEYYLLQQSSEMKRLKLKINYDLSELLQDKWKQSLENIQNKLMILQTLQENDITEIRNIVWKLRQGKEHSSTLENKVCLGSTKIKSLFAEINADIDELESKIKRIKELQTNGFEYCNVADIGIDDRIKEEIVNAMLCGNDIHKAIFYSTDSLRKRNPEEWTMIYSALIEERRKSGLHLVYADFTYSTCPLKKMKIERLSKDLMKFDEVTYKPSFTKVKRQAPLPPPQPSSADEYINILLLGESGVGKSTFVNAFANYLHFHTLQQAEEGIPIVIIPTSFIMTVNDDFEKCTIKFGESDTNENHNYVGQSVTQQCKSYVFSLSDKKKLRIIDTPGYGDTRGAEQDDMNMNEIFSFLNNFTYLNGVCLLFKPEVTQLNPYFRSCCSQLFDYFGENIRDHFIFCFTNARSTFLVPGNTGCLLNKFFESFSVKRIPFEKRNTFCFDNASFRYLVAKQNSIELDPSQTSKFNRVWMRSVAESERFRTFLCNLRSYRRNIEWQSVKDVRFQINSMIRPLLESMRNLLRNMLLSKSNSYIELYAKHTELSQMICYSCNRKSPKKVGEVWILPHYLHHPHNMCTSNKQKPTEYRLNYGFLSNQVDESFEEIKRQLRIVYEICAKLFYFLQNQSSTMQNDPFLTDAKRMMDEEQYICETQGSTELNKMLIDGLKQFQTKYNEQLNTLKSNKEQLTVSKMCDLIKSLDDIPMVKIQLDAIRDYQQHFIEKNQRTVQPT